jgi:hypothetical protein
VRSPLGTVNTAARQHPASRRERRDVNAAATPTGAPADAGAAPKLTVTEMEERLLATIDLAPEAMRALAEERADGVRGRIAEAAQIDPARLFLVEGGERAKKEGGRRVYFTLK